MQTIFKKMLALPALAIILGNTILPASAQYYYVRPYHRHPVLRDTAAGAGIGALGGLAVGALTGHHHRIGRDVGIGAGIGAGLGALHGWSHRWY